MNQPSIQDKEAYVIGLSIGCPIGEAMASCVMTAIRQEPIRTRIAWVRNMDERQLDTIIKKHKDCFNRRTALPPGPEEKPKKKWSSEKDH